MKPNLAKTALICTFAGSLILSGCGRQTAEEHIMAAEQFIAANNNSAAVLELKNAIQLDPTSAEARFRLGRLYAETKQFESAEKELNRAMDLGYSTAAVLPLLAKAYTQTGAVNALADVDYKEASLSAAESAELGYYKLTALVELEKNEDALGLIESIAQLDTQSVYKTLAKSYAAIIEQDYDTALAGALAARQQSPLNEDALQLLSKLQLIQRRFEDAVDTLSELNKLRPNDVEVLFTRLSLFIDLKRFDEAEPLVDKLLPLNTENGLLNQYKGMILASKDDHERALPYLSKALLNGRDNAVVRLLAGYSAYRVADYENTVKHLSLIAEQLPGNHPGLRILADSQLILGQNQAASNTLASFEDALQSDMSLYSRTGFGLLQQGDVEAAKDIVQKGSELDATATDLLRMGVLQLSLNDVDGLVKIEEAAKDSPSSTLAQSTLATAYLLSGELEKASALASSWKTQQPNAFQPYLLAGEIALRNENLVEAGEQYELARMKAPTSPDPKLAIANLKIVSGDLSGAEQALKAILADHPEHAQSLAVYYALQLEQGNVADALVKTEQAVATAEDKLPLQLLLARMQAQEQNFSSALETLQSIDTEQTLPPVYWQLKGQALLRTNDVKGAATHYETWHKSAPFNRDAVLGLLLTLDIQRQFEQALEVSKDFTSRRDDPQISALTAYFYAFLNRPQESLGILNTLSNEVQQLPFVRGIYARLALLDKRFADAIGDAQIAYDAQSNIRNLLLYVGALEGSGKPVKGFEVVKNHVVNNPNDQRANLLYAERLISRDKSQAISAYESSIDAIPDNFLALNNLAYLYLEQGRVDDALPLAEKAVGLQSKNPAAADTLAQIYVVKGELKRARTLYDKVVNDQTQNDEVITNYIKLLMQQGEPELAKRKAQSLNWASPQAKQDALKLVSGS